MVKKISASAPMSKCILTSQQPYKNIYTNTKLLHGDLVKIDNKVSMQQICPRIKKNEFTITWNLETLESLLLMVKPEETFILNKYVKFGIET